MKYLDENLTKHAQDLHAKNYKMLVKRNKDCTEKDNIVFMD